MKSSRHSVCFLSLSFVFIAANNSMQITADVIGRFSMLKFGACPNLSPHPLIAQWSLKTSFIKNFKLFHSEHNRISATSEFFNY